YGMAMAAAGTAGREMLLGGGFAGSRKLAGENAAFAQFRADQQPGIMGIQYVLYDGQSKPRAAALPRTVRAHAVKPLGQARNMALRDADAGIGHGKAGPVRGVFPLHRDAPAFGRVVDGVEDQVAKRAF